MAAHAVALLLIAAAVAAYARAGISHGMLVWDEAEYASLGRSLVRGEGYTVSGQPQPLRLPVLPVSVALSFALAGRADDEVAVRPIALFAAACLVAVFAFVARATDPATALVATALLATNLTFCSLATSLLTEVPFLVFWIAGLWCVFFALHEADWWLFPAWVLFALAWLTRYNAIAFGPVAVLYVLAAAALDIRTRWRELLRSRAFVAAPLAGLLVLVPWFIRQQATFGDALVGVRISFTQLGHYPADAQPATYYVTALPQLIGWPAVACMVVALVAFVRRREPATLFALIAAGFVLGWLSRYPPKDARLASSTIPFLLTLAAIGAGRVLVPALGRTASDAVAWRAAALPIATLIAVQAVNASVHLRQQVALGYPSFVQAMAFARNATPPGGRLLAVNIPQVTWYTDRPCDLLAPYEPDLPPWLSRADWIVITNFERMQPPYVLRLLDRLTPADYRDGGAVMFRDAQFLTVLVRTDRLQTKLHASRRDRREAGFVQVLPTPFPG